MKKYDNYKDSGIEWIGEIPEHWFSTTLKRIAEVKDGTHDTPSYVEEDGIPFITTKDLSNGNISFENCKYISYDDYLSINRRSNVENGDIIMPMIGSIGSPIIVKTDKPFSIKNLALIKKNTECDLRYICYYLDSEATLYQFGLCTSGGVQNFISLGVLRNLGIPKMEKDEQTAIANYLDHKTTQIDTLIAKKEQFISLLQEERTAVINQAVTKGLDPKVKMKDSGIEWLGEIPEHWEVKKLKYLANLKSGNNIISEQITPDGLYPVYGGNGLRGYFSDYTNDGNFVLIGRQGALCGNINYATDKFWASEHAIVCYLNPKNEWIWLGELLRIMNLNQYSQASAQPGLSVEKIKNLSIPVPNEIEQKTIVEYIFHQRNRIDTLISKSQQEIELLKEYKTALISEVVTGKVDVREVVLN